MKTGIIVAMAVLCCISTYAQTQPIVSYTVGIWPGSAADQNTTSPINTAVYPVSSVQCGQPRIASTAKAINPDEVRFNDPGNAALDCVVSIGPQIRALPSGSYRAALKVDGALESSAYGTWSEIFQRQGPPANPSAARVRSARHGTIAYAPSIRS